MSLPPVHDADLHAVISAANRVYRARTKDARRAVNGASGPGTTLGALSLPARCETALTEAGIDSIELLGQCTRDRLMRVNGLGALGVTQVLRCLHEYSEGQSRPEPRQPRPTNYRPGSPAKIEVLAKRLDRGEALHHPDDERVLARVCN